MTKREKSIRLLQNYLVKHPSRFPIEQLPRGELGIIVVIPAYRENRLLFKTLESLRRCDPPRNKVEVIIVLNASEADDASVVEEQEASFNKINKFIQNGVPSWLSIFPIRAFNLRKKHFGAGLARKTGLDEAVRRFLHFSNPDGILVCLDADSPVALNYLTAIEEWFHSPENQGAIIHFEHPLNGTDEPAQAYEAITLYELHLRYYLMALRQTGFPYAYHTIGSCMVFRALKYVQAGGMPKKQAGEDFYFLQKLIPLGGFGEIKNTTVFPSPRASDRVIFGTGASVKQHLDGSRKQGTTYDPRSFEDLELLFSKVMELRLLPPEKFEEWTYELTGPLRSFLLNTDFEHELDNIQRNSNSEETFIKRFFGAFNAFRVVKYLNYVHEHFYGRADIFDAAAAILEKSGEDVSEIFDEKELLLKYREFELGTP